MNFILMLCLLISSNLLAETGVLFTAYGSNDTAVCTGNQYTRSQNSVIKITKSIKNHLPEYETVFSLSNAHCFNYGIQKLKNKMLAKGKELTEIKVLPLFISSHSIMLRLQKSVIQSFANFNGKIHFLPALDYHPVVSMIMANRLHHLIHLGKDQGFKKSEMELIMIMHGPAGDADNEKWMKNAKKLMNDIFYLFPIGGQGIVSLRDDASATIRDMATSVLRARILNIQSRGHMPLILPLYMSSYAITRGLNERISDISGYIYSGEAILPDTKLADYILNRISQGS